MRPSPRRPIARKTFNKNCDSPVPKGSIESEGEILQSNTDRELMDISNILVVGTLGSRV